MFPRHQSAHADAHLDPANLPGASATAHRQTVITCPQGFLAKHADDEGLPQEVEFGNVEYKRHLVGIAPDRLEHLCSQMMWRLSEGSGEALYELGIDDDGALVGLTQYECDESVKTLEKMAAKLAADCSIVRKRALPADTAGAEPRVVVECLVRKRVEEEHFLELTVALLGASDSGKSTLLGVLTHGELCSGYGRARVRAFNHAHELTSGRTSSLAHALVGFDSAGKLVNYTTPGVTAPLHVAERAAKLVTVLDTCGLAKYLPTTLAGITAARPHYAVLVVSATAPVDQTVRECLGVALVLNMPLAIVINKVDAAQPDQVTACVAAVAGVLKGPGSRRVPVLVKNEDDLVACVPHVAGGSTVPLFLCSCVSGANLPLVTQMLNLLPMPPMPAARAEQLASQPATFSVREVFDVPAAGTAVLGGTVLTGTIHVAPRTNGSAAPVSPNSTAAEHLLLGPFDGGVYRKARVVSIQRLCRPARYVRAGHSATLAVEYVDAADAGPMPAASRRAGATGAPIPAAHVRRGMQLVASPRDATAHWTLDVEVHVLYHASANGLAPGQTCVIFCGAVRQAARVVAVLGPADAAGAGEVSPPRTGERARVRFAFANHAEAVRAGDTLLAREGRAGRMKLVGKIVGVGAGDAEVLATADAAARRAAGAGTPTTVLAQPQQQQAVSGTPRQAQQPLLQPPKSPTGRQRSASTGSQHQRPGSSSLASSDVVPTVTPQARPRSRAGSTGSATAGLAASIKRPNPAQPYPPRTPSPPPGRRRTGS